MYRSLFLTALAGTALIVAIGHATTAQSTVMSPEDRDICLLLEFAHDSTCGEYELVHDGGLDAMVTGGIAPAETAQDVAPQEKAPATPTPLPAGR